MGSALQSSLSSLRSLIVREMENPPVPAEACIILHTADTPLASELPSTTIHALREKREHVIETRYKELRDREEAKGKSSDEERKALDSELAKLAVEEKKEKDKRSHWCPDLLQGRFIRILFQ